MLDFFKKRFYSFVDDKLQRVSIFTFIIIVCVSVLNLTENLSLEWILRLCIYSSGVLLTFFFGNKGTWITWFISVSILFYFSTYRNISYFTITTMLIVCYPKMKWPLLIIYAIQVFIICHLHDVPIKNVLYHTTLCVWVFLTTEIVKTRIEGLNKNNKLELTSDERIILEYLSHNIKQNDICEFSPVTVSRKLRQAKIRNGISSTNKIVEIYKKENCYSI